jgi:hypothetical protein
VKHPRQRNPAPRPRARASLLALALALCVPVSLPAQSPAPRGPLSELKERRRVTLLVSRTQTIDARDRSRGAFENYRRALAGNPPRPHAAAHRAVARQLNKYILKHRSLTAVESIHEAEFVIVFNVLRARRSFVPDEPYVYGQLFVIARPIAAGTPPRIVWESEGDDTNAEDAVNDFLKALRTLRGER